MRYFYKDLIARGMTAVTAHSGCEGTAPNSIEHIKSAIASGSEFIEIDVRKKDSLLYLSHDLPEQPENCVKLAECFRLVAAAENLYMNIDVKEYGLIPSILELSDAYRLRSRIIFTGCCNDDRKLAADNGSEVWRSMFWGDFIPDGIAAIRRDGSPALNVYHKLITEEYNAELRSMGLGFSAWTVDTEEDICRYLEMGIMNITTRKPVLALRLRNEIQGTIDRS